jgi:tripartite-type tricarboxylate transporter receptor subunit TctC
VINPLLIKDLPYDGRTDFAPIIALAASPPIIVAHPSFQANTLGELISLARSQPGMLQYASPGIGSSGHLAMEVLQDMAGIRLQAVQYRGAAPSVQDLVAGRVLLGVDGLPGQLENVRSGVLKALAISDAQRSPVAPQIPTISETVPGFDVTAWYGLFAPAGSPPDVLSSVSRAVDGVLKDPEVRRQLEARGFRIMGGTPEDLAQFVHSEFVRWERVLSSVSIVLE